MGFFIEFNKTFLSTIKVSRNTSTVSCIGHRTLIITNHLFESPIRFLDSDKKEKYQSVDFFTDQRGRELVVVAGNSGIIKFIDVSCGRLIGALKGHTGPIFCIRVKDDYLYSCGQDTSIRVWDLHRQQCAIVLGGILSHKDSIHSLDINFDSSRMITAGRDTDVIEWCISDALAEYRRTLKQQYIGKPFNVIDDVHKEPIFQVMYYGDIIVSRTSTMIYFLYNCRETFFIPNTFNLSNDLFNYVFLGKIQLSSSCTVVKIVDGLVVILEKSGTVKIYEINTILNQSSPILIQSNVEEAVHMDILGDEVYVLGPNRIKKISVNFERFTIESHID